MRRSPALLLGLTAAALAAAPPATAAEGPTLTNPGFPGNDLHVDVPDQLVGTTVVSGIALRGVATWRENPTTAATGAYAFSVYVQDAAAAPTCSATRSLQVQQASATPGLNATSGASGFVVDGDALSITPPVPAFQATYRLPVPSFVIRSGIRRVLLCAYQRSGADEVASRAATAAVVRPSCRLRSSSVRRGSSFRLRCNVDGRVSLRLRRSGTTRTLRGTVPRSGSKALSSKRIPKGRYRATIVGGGRTLGTQTVRVR